MTKHELARQIATDVGITAGRDVAIAGFGEFSVTERAAREGRNPATGEALQIAASRAAKFAAAAALKGAAQQLTAPGLPNPVPSVGAGRRR